MTGGSVADLVRCLALAVHFSPFATIFGDELSSDFDRLYELMRKFFLCVPGIWSDSMMAPLSGEDLRSLFEGFGGFIDNFAEGGVESKSEKRRNMICFMWLKESSRFELWLLWKSRTRQ